LISFSCFQKSNTLKLYRLSGQTMGTTYNISYFSLKEKAVKKSVDSLLKVINQANSTYISSSTISKFNKHKSTKPFLIDDIHFENVYSKAKEIYRLSDGNFDPTVMPLVNYWGFGPDKREVSDKKKLKSILKNQIGFSKIIANKNGIQKKHKGIEIDFSAIAKGYAVDKISDLLSSKNINSHLVEIGGEVVAKGTKANNQNWKLGIDDPNASLQNRKFQSIVALKDKGLATSGNYRNYKMKDGKKVVHTINPKTGYSEISNLLSCSVIANDCETADAFATAFMVMGLKESKKYLMTDKLNLDVFLIYTDLKTNEIKTWKTKNFPSVKNEN